MKKSEYLYLDHAATTPMREIAIKAFIDAEHEGFANSSGGHNLSRKAKNILEESREIISSIFAEMRASIFAFFTVVVWEFPVRVF